MSVEREPDKKALYALLSQLAGRYVKSFDERPVPGALAANLPRR
jgi:hypothetical protein